MPTIRTLRDAFYAESPPPPWRDESWEARGDDVVDVVRAAGAFIAEHAGEPAGFALAWPEGTSAWKLGDLYVRPRHRGGGIGRALLGAVAALARSRGASHLHLTANLGALAFYERLGFSEESRNLVVQIGATVSGERSATGDAPTPTHPAR